MIGWLAHELWPAIYGLLSLSMLRLAWLVYKRDRARSAQLGCAMLLTLTWAATNTFDALLTQRRAEMLFPLMDGLSAAALMATWFRGPTGRSLPWFRRAPRWMLTLAFLFVVQCALHVAFQASIREQPGAYTALDHVYRWILNGTFLLQWIAVGAGGGFQYAWARLRDYLPHRSGLGHHVLPGPP